MTSLRRMPVLAGLLCLLLMGFAGASYGAVRFDVVPSPTEVINTGRSEVLGSLNLVVRDVAGNVTGTATGGPAQIGIIYNNPAVQIDNTTTTGIRLFYTSGFAAAFATTAGGIIGVQNIDLNGKCVGYITLNLLPGATPTTGDFIRLDGVRGRIDASGTGLTPGTNLFAQMQSINDPSANQFFPETVRVATTFDGMNIEIKSMNLLLCFPTSGLVPGGTYSNYIKITEGFARAFVDNDSNGAGIDSTDRVDSGSQANPLVYTVGGVISTSNALGSPTNQTHFSIFVTDIPKSVSGIDWQGSVAANEATGATLDLVSSTIDLTAGTASALYQFNATNQTGASDVTVESFTLMPKVVLKTGNQTDTGTINVGVSLAPMVTSLTSCAAPSSTASRPRFLQMIESDAVALGNPPDDPYKPYAVIIRCNCFLLFTYVTSDSAFDTGIAIANTTGDTGPFGTSEAPDQIGRITFYFYDKAKGYVGSYTTSAETLSGYSWVNVLSAVLPNVTPSPLTSFSGYVITKAEFQYCHALAFIADTKFGGLAHGYIANVIPDPAIKTGKRSASDAGDVGNWYWNGTTTVQSSPIPAGEGLNN